MEPLSHMHEFTARPDWFAKELIEATPTIEGDIGGKCRVGIETQLGEPDRAREPFGVLQESVAEPLTVAVGPYGYVLDKKAIGMLDHLD